MKRLTEGNIWKNFILFAIPLVLSGLLGQAYTMIDTMIAGHWLGEEGLAAIGSTSSAITFVSSLFWGYLAGFGMYVARLFGEGAYEQMRRGVWVTLGICTAVSITLSTVCIACADPILTLLNVEPSIWADAKAYFCIYAAGFFIFQINTGAIFMLGSLGDSAFPFYMSLLSSLLNVAGNVLSITVLRMGVVGVAWSSVLSAVVTTLFFVLRFRSIFKKLLPNSPKIKWSLRETKIALPYSVPPIIQQGTIYVVGLLLAPLVNSFGEAVIASYVVSSQIQGLIGAVYGNASRAVSNYTAQCAGGPFENADKRRRMRSGIGVGLVQSISFSLVLLIPCMLAPEWIASVFFAEGSAQESIALTVYFERVFLPCTLLNAVTNLFHGVFRAVKAKGLLIFSTVFSSVVRLAVSYPLTVQYGLNGFWAGMAISWGAEVLMLIVVYFKSWWIPRELRESTCAPE